MKHVSFSSGCIIEPRLPFFVSPPTSERKTGMAAPERPASRRMVLLAPPSAHSRISRHAESNPSKHRRLLAQAQRLRARVYLEDGAIRPHQVTPDGRFAQHADQHSWHLLVLGSDGEVAGCARYRSHHPDTRFEDLGTFNSALARHEYWGQRLRRAVETMMRAARDRGIGFVECGGWALHEDLRCSTEAVRIALGMYALARFFDGAIGITTATKRHHSSLILRRIGGSPLTADGVELPAYYDPQYGCEMEVLGFDSSAPAGKFEPYIQQCRLMLSSALIVQSAPVSRDATGFYPQNASAGDSGTDVFRTQVFTENLLALSEFARFPAQEPAAAVQVPLSSSDR